MPNNATTEALALGRKLRGLREDKDAAKKALAAVNDAIEQCQRQLVDEMVNLELLSFDHDGCRFTLSEKLYASANAGQRDELFAALKHAGFGDLVYETVNANSLSAFVREQMEANEDTLPPWLKNLVNVYQQNVISMRKSARKGA